ncbi:NAD(P)H-dependent oxidoreductase subunit E [Myxococcota bacterium]|nr:NAD(P)H-dependent oxidoreductase subunit E [Myxococcota bacterium]
MADARFALAHASIERYAGDRDHLLQALIDLQDALHHVPADVLPILERGFSATVSEIRALIGFYSFLSDVPLGEYVVHFSDNVIDHMAGSRALARQLCRLLGVRIGETRADGRVSVHFTSCTGMADQPPAALINHVAVPRLDPAKIDRIAALIEARTPLDAWPPELFVVEDRIRRSDVVFRWPIEPGQALKAAMKRGDSAVDDSVTLAVDGFDASAASHVRMDRGAMETLRELYRAELRGCGGAGFWTAVKWQGARERPGPRRFVLCNADEGEPGTFKDRVLLTRWADMVLEGMTLCGYVIGAQRGVIYVRREYTYLKRHLEEVLARRRAAGLLGKEILGTSLEFDVELQWGAGAYICGMETAMIESIEGRRGAPRRRFPLPIAEGYQGCPTVVNNVETFAAAAAIAVRGGAWYAQQGTPQSRGSKMFCVSGDVERPGIYEYPWGVSLREVLRDSGAEEPLAIQVGGPSGTLISRAELDRRLCFEDLPTVGTLMVFGPRRNLFDVVRNFVEFFQHESCGLCTPCRVGTTLLRQTTDRFAARVGSPLDLQRVRELAKLMKTASHCGLGQTAPNPLSDAIQKFPDLFEDRMCTTDAAPAFDIERETVQARALAAAGRAR